MSAYYNKGQKFKCPHLDCEEEQEYNVEDYVIGGRVGCASYATDRCVHCDEVFSVQLDEDGRFYVAEAEED